MATKRKDWKDQTNEELVSGFQNILDSVQDVHPRYLLLRSLYIGIELGKRQQKAKEDNYVLFLPSIPSIDNPPKILCNPLSAEPSNETEKEHNPNNLGSIISHGQNE